MLIVDKIDRHDYSVKWLVVVGTDHQEFIDSIEKVGGESYLEENKLFAIFFDTTPLDKIHTEMQDYTKIRDRYKNSHRVLAKSLYIGNIPEDEHGEAINKFLNYCSDKPVITWSNIKLGK